jgi:hypothetical protein
MHVLQRLLPNCSASPHLPNPCAPDPFLQSSAVAAAAPGGPVYHYSRQYVDSGWGCGYRNIQMLCGYLLQRDPAYAAALFGGRGFVPDIRE